MTAFAQNPNWPLSGVHIDFTRAPNAPAGTPVWQDVSDRVQQIGSAYGRQYELNAMETGTMTVGVLNQDEALTPANANSPFNSGSQRLLPYRPIRWWAMWPLAGNILNGTNFSDWGISGDTAAFEGGLGSWSQAGTVQPTIAQSATRSHDGAHSMLVTWPTGAGGKGTLVASSLYANDLAATFPVRAGVTYTASAWVWVGSGPAVVINCNNVDGGQTSTTGAWQRISVSFVASSSYDHRIFLYPAAATTAGQQVWVSSVQFEVGASASPFTTAGPTIYPIHTGFIEKYPGTWTQAGNLGWQALGCVDALAVLPRLSLSDVMTNEQVKDGAVVAYPLDEAAGAYSFANYGSQKIAPRLTPARWGDLQAGKTPASIDVGNSSVLGPGGAVDGSTCATFTPGAVGDGEGLNAVFGPIFNIGGTPNGSTLEIWFRATAVTGGMGICTGVDDGPMVELRFDGTGGLWANYSATYGNSFAYTMHDTHNYDDGQWHHAVLRESVSGTTVTAALFVDGVKTQTAQRPGPTSFRVLELWLGSQFAPWFAAPYKGDLARAAVYETALTDAQIASHTASARGFDGDDTGTRIARVLGWLGWNSPTNIRVGASTCAPLVIARDTGTNATKANQPIQDAAVTENGAFYAAPNGALTFTPRDAYYLQTTPRWIFGEAETPYREDLGLDTDSQYLFNRITVTRNNGTPQTVQDTTSGALYWEFDGQVNTIHADDTQAATLAQNLLNRYSQSRPRIATLTIFPAADPTLWPVALGARYGDRVRVIRRTAAGATYTIDGYIERVEHAAATQSGWATKFQISPAYPGTPWVLGDTVRGVIGTTNVIVY